MNAKLVPALCVCLGTTAALAYAITSAPGFLVAPNESANALNGASATSAPIATTLTTQREFCFSETLESMSCEDQMIDSAVTGHPSASSD
jgi:hypothetical protein